MHRLVVAAIVAQISTAPAAGQLLTQKPPGAPWTVVEVRYPSNGASTAWITSDPAGQFACDPPVAAPAGAKPAWTVRCRAVFSRASSGRPASVSLRMRYAVVAGVGSPGQQGLPIAGAQWTSGCTQVTGEQCRVALTASTVTVVVSPTALP